MLASLRAGRFPSTYTSHTTPRGEVVVRPPRFEPRGPPVPALLVTLLDKFGIPVDKVGDSTGGVNNL